MNEDHKISENQLSTPVFDPSRRPSGRTEFEGENAPQVGGDSSALGSDSIPISGIPSSSAGAGAVKKKSTKLTRAQLVEIEDQLTARDHAVLQAIKKYRFLTSDQIGRLYVTDCSTKTSRTRNQNLLDYWYPVYKVLEEEAPQGMWDELARLVGLDSVFSVDL